MNLELKSYSPSQYKSNSQRIRVLTEGWMEKNMFCPYCGAEHIFKYANNRPVHDFFCDQCQADYELKSKKNTFGKKIMDGAYSTMMQIILSKENPHFFFLNYIDSKGIISVRNLMLVPGYFFTSDSVEKRKALSAKAKRPGWVGCNILYKNIPVQGQIYIIKDGVARTKKEVMDKVNSMKFLNEFHLEKKGWFFDILNCVNRIDKNEFSLKDVYQFETYLANKHPENKYVKEKIRQQLQLLRDKNIIEFLGKGKYQKI